MMPAATKKKLDVEAWAVEWAQRSDISARSVLVTILGDSIVPIGGVVWLSDLIELAAPFGFSERLVRTSMYRLVAERWVTNERIGRQSQYSLTDFGRDEFEHADRRIYGQPTRDAWDGEWTLVFLNGHADDIDLLRHLRWRGFAEMSKDVHALPTSDTNAARHVFEQLAITEPPAVATARFDDSGPITATDLFRSTSGLADAEAAYLDFIDRYRPLEAATAGALSPKTAFVLRTMLIHDLRRVRLRDPELPEALLPSDWIGQRALTVAAALYRAADTAAWQWIAEITDLTADPKTHPLAQRFPTAA